MMINSLRAYVVCTECNYGFVFSVSIIHNRLKDIYRAHLKHQLKWCDKCGKGSLVIRDMECKIESPKTKECFITWKCMKCGMKWAHAEYIDKSKLAEGKFISQIVPKVICPNTHCLASDDIIMVSMSNSRPTNWELT